jgi:hypothetical protein
VNDESDRKSFPIKPEHQWVGVFPKSAEHFTGYFVTARKQWEDLWNLYRPNTPVPDVDFRSTLILINRFYGADNEVTAWLSTKGDLTTVEAVRKPSNDNTTMYAITAVNKLGVSTLNGTKLESLGISTFRD